MFHDLFFSRSKTQRDTARHEEPYKEATGCSLQGRQTANLCLSKGTESSGSTVMSKEHQKCQASHWRCGVVLKELCVAIAISKRAMEFRSAMKSISIISRLWIANIMLIRMHSTFHITIASRESLKHQASHWTAIVVLQQSCILMGVRKQVGSSKMR